MAVVTTSSAEQLLVLRKAEDDRLRKQGNGKAQLAFAKDVKQSLLFQFDWADLLSAAPLALASMGSCYIAATSPKAQGISLEECKPTGGWSRVK